MANTDYGRLSTDDHDEERPLLSNHLDQPEQSRSSNRSLFQRLKSLLNATFAPLATPQHLGPLERFLIFLSVVLLLLTAVFIGLFAGARHRLSHHPSKPIPDNPHHQPPSNPDVCTSEQCVIIASEIIRGIDTSVDPCHDFYAFSAGGWLKNHPIPGDAGLFGTGQFVAQENAKIIKKILDDVHPTSQEDNADSDNLAKLKAYYTSCIDTDAQDKAGPEPLLELIHEIRQRLNGSRSLSNHDEHPLPLQLQLQPQLHIQSLSLSGKPLPPNQPPGRSPRPHPPKEDPKPAPPSSERQTGLTQVLAWAHSRGLPVLFETFMDGDPVKDPKAATPYITPSGLGLPDRSYYKDKDELDFYRSVVEQGLRLLEKEEQHKKEEKKNEGKFASALPNFEHLAAQVVEFERQIADITPDSEDLSDPIRSYNAVNASSLPYLFSAIDWPTYLSALSVRTPKRFIVPSLSFLTSLDSLVSRTRTGVLEAYFTWTAVRTLGTSLGPNVSLRAPAERLDRYVTGVDADAKQDRESFCLMDLNEQLGFMTGRYFVKEAFKGDSKDRVETIIKSVIDAFKSRLSELDWLDDQTRSRAQEKADAIRILVGYPTVTPNTSQPTSVRDFYADLPIRSTDYFKNRLHSLIRLKRRDWAQSGRQLDAKWDMFPSEVNAEYSPQANHILFPAGIMQPPYFHISWPSYLQYGAFGAVAGHELSHAFDPDGRLYDKDGYLRNWWSNKTSAAFRKRQDCLVNQYASYTIPGSHGIDLHLKANFTKGEDVADAGGLSQSYRAWKDSSPSPSSSSSSLRLPGLPYTPDQLFFIAYGLSWARNIRPSELVRRLHTDPHSPTRFRVNGVLVNNPQFQRVFSCVPGKHQMAKLPKDVCSIW